MKIVGRILKYAVLALIFGVIAFLLVRILIAEYYPREMKALYPTDNLKSAYAADPNLEIRRQDLGISYDNPEFALFMANHQYYCPAAGELQIALRYNHSTLGEVQKDFGLDAAPLPSPDLFDFTLFDDNGNRYPLSFMTTDAKFMYEYYKLAFSDVDFGEATNWIRLDIYYRDAVDYSKEPYACILLYNKELVSGDSIYIPAQGELAP